MKSTLCMFVFYLMLIKINLWSPEALASIQPIGVQNLNWTYPKNDFKNQSVGLHSRRFEIVGVRSGAKSIDFFSLLSVFQCWIYLSQCLSNPQKVNEEILNSQNFLGQGKILLYILILSNFLVYFDKKDHLIVSF